MNIENRQARCSIKEERTVRYWMSHRRGVGLPYVMANIVPHRAVSPGLDVV